MFYLNKCYRLDSSYKTTLFQGMTANDEKFPMRLPNEDKNLTATEFVMMICDVFLMHKNLCICRHFDLYNKNDIIKYDNMINFTTFFYTINFYLFRNPKYNYIDVWPINFFGPSMNDAYDTSSLFMLQLSCIIKMIAVYKKHTLRVHLLNTIDIQSQRVQLKQLLSTLRIKAVIHEVILYYEVQN